MTLVEPNKHEVMDQAVESSTRTDGKKSGSSSTDLCQGAFVLREWKNGCYVNDLLSLPKKTFSRMSQCSTDGVQSYSLTLSYDYIATLILFGSQH